MSTNTPTTQAGDPARKDSDTPLHDARIVFDAYDCLRLNLIFNEDGTQIIWHIEHRARGVIDAGLVSPANQSLIKLYQIWSRYAERENLI